MQFLNQSLKISLYVEKNPKFQIWSLSWNKKNLKTLIHIRKCQECRGQPPTPTKESHSSNVAARAVRRVVDRFERHTLVE